MGFFTFSFSVWWLSTSQERNSGYSHAIADSQLVQNHSIAQLGDRCAQHRDLLHNRWPLIATGDQQKRDEINVSGPPWWNMSCFRQSNKHVHTAFHTRVLLREFLHIKSSLTCDINLYCTGLKNKSGLSPCRQRGFSSTAHLACSLKFFQSSDKLLKVVHW